jgi:hypothetical protein
MEFINQFRVGYGTGATPDITVLERVGACGTFANTLNALAAAQGISARFINLYNFPKNNGHTMVELKIDGKWQVYDPTYGSFYVKESDQNTIPLSLQEIREALQNGLKVKRIGQVIRYPNPFDLDQEDAKLLGLVSSAPWTWFDGFTNPEIFLKAEPSGVIGPDRPMIFPLTLDYRLNPMLSESLFGPKFQGADYIGAAFANQNQKWILSGLATGEQYLFSIVPKELGGDIKNDNQTFRLRVSVEKAALIGTDNHLFDFSREPRLPWVIRFKADGPEAILTLTHPYHGPELRYMLMTKYAIQVADKDRD